MTESPDAPAADAVADALYAIPPDEFVAARESQVRAARAAKDRDAAAQIHALGKPTLSAWALNQLSRQKEARGVLDLGVEMRHAFRELDASAVRPLLVQQRKVVARLTQLAVTLAAASGHPLSSVARDDVQGTLYAVLADPAAAQAWAEGRLTHPITPPAELPGVVAPPRAPAAAREDPAAPAARSDASERRERKREERIAAARTAAEDAARELEAREAGQAAADRALDDARAGHSEAAGRVAALADELKAARADEKAAADGMRDAEATARSGQESLRTARRRAQDAAAKLDRLRAQ